MNKEQFLKQLNASLTRLSLEEREDILTRLRRVFRNWNGRREVRAGNLQIPWES